MKTLDTLFSGLGLSHRLTPPIFTPREPLPNAQLHEFRPQFLRLETYLNADVAAFDFDDCASLGVCLSSCLRLLAGACLLSHEHVWAITAHLFGQVFHVKHDEKSDKRGDAARASLLARSFDPSFWRRNVYTRSLQLREFRAQLAGRLGKSCPYATPFAVEARRLQKEKHKTWVENTTLTCSSILDEDGKPLEISLETVVKTAQQHFAKIYTFVEALDVLGHEDGLESALVTLTLPGDWHSNPTYKRKGWAFNGKTPKEASDELGKRWGKVRQYLDNRGIYLSGIWVLEMHKDGTPHRHLLIYYRPEHRGLVMSKFLEFFPTRLKLRFGSDKSLDRGFTSPENCVEGKSYPLGSATSPLRRLGYAVDFAVINRSESKPASYIFKYLEKTLLADASLHDSAFASVDAARFVWRLRSYQFFGVDGQTVWDKLRALNTAPEDDVTRALWVTARGGEKEGRVSAEDQKGDAVQFLRLMGGLKACRSGRVSRAAAGDVRDVVKVAREATVTRYQEEGSRAIGLVRVSSVYAPAPVACDPETGEITMRLRWQVSTGAFTRTRFHDWQLRSRR